MSKDIEISSAEEGVKTYVTHCRQHHRAVNQEILRDHMTAIQEQQRARPQGKGREEGGKTDDVSIYSDSRDCEEDVQMFVKRRGSSDRNVHIRKQREEVSSGGESGESGSSRKSSGRKNQKGKAGLNVSRALPISGATTSVTQPHSLKRNDQLVGRVTGSKGGQDGSRDCPVCLDSDSDSNSGDGEDDGYSDGEVVLSTTALSSQGTASSTGAVSGAVSVNNFLSKGKKRQRQQSLAPLMSFVKNGPSDDLLSAPELVIPTGHYFDSRTNRCLKYTPFVVNSLELRDLFAEEVYDSTSASDAFHSTGIPSESFLKDREVAMHPNLSECLKPHQKDAVLFLWKNVMLGVLEYSEEKNADGSHRVCNVGDEGDNNGRDSRKKMKTGAFAPGHGCILAHFMGLGKTLTIISFLATIMCGSPQFVTKNMCFVIPCV